MFVKVEEVDRDWSDFTLVAPAVSVGNVGQLATDLFISSLSPTLAGYFHTDSVLPVVGCDPYTQPSSDHLATAIQVYESSALKLVILQQRAPCVRGKTEVFVSEMIGWIRACRFKQVVLLTSMFAHERLDSQITGPQTRYLMTPGAKRASNLADSVSWVELESRSSELSKAGELFIPGGGIAKRLYSKCLDEDISLAVLLVFTDEGDNIADALKLASYANQYLQILPISGKQASFKIPVSWTLTFGNLTDRSLFH